MSILKKALTTAALATALIATGAHAEPKRIALVVKALGIGFFEAANKGAEEAAKELGDVEVIYTGPTDTTAEGQIEVINALIAQKVDAIAISANDTDALVPTLKKAMDRGITVISWDSGVAKDGRQMHLNPSSSPLIGNMIIKLAADNLPDGGDVAVLSATSTSTNVGIVAAAQAVEDAGKVGQVNVTGLGLPSEMAGHVHAGSSKSFAIWNPIDLGYAATMIAYNLASGKATAEAGGTIPMGRMGDVTLDDNLEGAMADPFVYDATNVDEFSSIF
jgi:rhamnose transport system substrate-binding protein